MRRYPRLIEELKSLLNDPKLNGAGTVHELGSYRKKLLLCSGQRMQRNMAQFDSLTLD